MPLLRTALLLFCLGMLLPACGKSRVDVDTRLAEIEAEREDFRERLAKVKDESLRDELGQVARVLFWMRKTEIESARKPEETVYGEDPLAILDDYDDADAMARNYAGGIIAIRNGSWANHVEVEWPFEYPFENTLVWDAATLEDGTRLPVTDDGDKAIPYMNLERPLPGMDDEGEPAVADGPGVVFQRDPTKFEAYLRDREHDDVPPVRQLKGMLTLQVPGHVHRVGFAPGEVGKAREAGGFRVKLESLEGHQARVSIMPPVRRGEDAAESARRLDKALDNKMITLTARDASGQTLKSSSRSGGASGRREQLQHVLDDIVAEASRGEAMDLESLKARMKTRERELAQASDGGLFRGATFRGRIAELDVVLIDPADVETREVPLSLAPMHAEVPRNTREPVPFPVAATVYDHSLDGLDGDTADEVDPTVLDGAIKVAHVRYDDIADAASIVRFEYPDVNSNRFVGVFDRYEEALEVTFLDADGAPIAMPADGKARKELYEFTVNRIEYHRGKFPVSPARVTGRLKVRLMPELRRQWLEADQLPEEAELAGNAYFGPSAYDNRRPRVHAKDRTGRYLRKMFEVRHVYDDARPRLAYHFYGEPARILLLEAGPTESAEYRFDVDLTGE